MTMEWVGAVPGVFWAGLSLLLKGSVVLLAACVATWWARGATPARRHLVWTFALLALLALPVLGGVLPSWSAWPEAWTPPPARLAFDIEAESLPASLFATDAFPAPTIAVEPQAPSAGIEPGEGVAEADGGPLTSTAAAREATGGAGPVRVTFTDVRPEALGLWAAGGFWAVGLLWVLAWIARGLYRVRRLGRTATLSHDDAWRSDLEAARAALGVRRPVTLRLSAEVPVPVTWGLLRPVVLMPAAAASWPAARRRQAILHEVAHIARLDQPLLIAAQCACALHWLNPLAWFALRELRRECELATDDRVLSCGVRASEYAAGLVAVAREIREPSRLPAAAFAMARSSQLGGRVHSILDPHRGRAGATHFDVLALAIVAAGFVAPLAALASSRETTAQAPVVEAVVAEWPASALTSPSAPEWPSPPTPPVAIAPAPDVPSGGVPSVRPPSAPLDGGWPAVAAPPATQEMSCFSRDRRIKSDMVEVNDAGMKARWATEECQWRLVVSGHVHFSDDERSVLSLTPGGSLEIEQTGIGPDREYRVEEVDGHLVATYRVDGATSRGGDAGSDEEAEAWLAQVIPELHRATGLDTDERVSRLLARGGVSAVLQEVGRIPSGYTARRYLQKLLTSVEASEADIAQALLVAVDRIDSDHEMRTLLTSTGFDLGSAVVRDAYLKAAATIDSDYELRTALEAFFADGATAEEAKVIIGLARGIGSDYERRTLLTKAASEVELDAAGLDLFVRMAANIDSDYELRETIRSVLEQPSLAEGQAVRLLALVDDMDSDFERAEMLLDFVRTFEPLSGALNARLQDSARTIDSDYERQRVESALRRAASDS